MRHCGLCWSYKVQEGTALDVAGESGDILVPWRNPVDAGDSKM
jgi:hypothetical protein